MTHAAIRSRLLALGIIAIVSAGLGACHDDSLVAPHTPVPPVDQMANLGSYIVHVDRIRGTVEVTPVGDVTPTMPKGVSARFYGKQGDIEHVFHFDSSVETPVGSGVAEWFLTEHINNSLGWAIGTNSPHTAPVFPQDTMGIYVYLNTPPPPGTASCPLPATCTAVMDSADGAYPFTSPTPQKYMFFKTILEQGTFGVHSGRSYTDQTSVGGTNYFRVWHWKTTGFVSNFSYGISVSAAWVDPHETRWKVFYVPDSLPNQVSANDLRTEPDWRVLGTGGGTPSIVTGKLQIVSTAAVVNKDTLIYFRSDSVRNAQDAYITATLATSGQNGARPGVFLGLQDGAKLVQMGISNTLLGFTDTTGAFVGTPVAVNPQHSTYRVAKFATDSAAIYSPPDSANAVVRIDYSSLPTAPTRIAGSYDRFFFFGNVTQTLAPSATSLWSSVNYEVGAHAP